MKSSVNDGVTVETLFLASSAGKALGCPIEASAASMQVSRVYFICWLYPVEVLLINFTGFTFILSFYLFKSLVFQTQIEYSLEDEICLL